MICPTGFTAYSYTNATTGQIEETCANSQGYTQENLTLRHEMAKNKCQTQLPMLIGLGLGVLFLPGAWKIVPIAFLPIYLGVSEFGGPGCSALMRGNA